MKRLCAWCARDLGDKPGDTDVITHGICDDCADAMVARHLRPGTRVRRRGGSPVVGEVTSQLQYCVLVRWQAQGKSELERPRGLEVVK